MGSMDVKVRCPKCHGRFYFALAEIGPDHTAGCPNCETPIKVRVPETGTAPPSLSQPAIVDVPAQAAPAASERRPWWKRWTI